MSDKSQAQAALAEYVFNAPPNPSPCEYQGWLDGVVRLSVAAELRGVSVDTMRREGAAGRLKLIQMTDDMVGCRRRDALKLPLPGRGGRRKAGGRKNQED
jgi:hypothetical protein